MPATRRVFLKKATAAALMAAGSLKSWSQQGRELTTAELIGRETMESATAQDWEKWIGGTFKLSWQGKKVGALILESVETKTFPVSRANPSQDPGLPSASPMQAPVMVRETQSIVLVFRTTGRPLIQEDYTLQQNSLGTFDLLLVPASPATPGSKYTAVITRLTGRMVPIE